MIYAQPGESTEATADWGITGLSGGTIGYTIYDNVGGTTTARTTSGIVEIAHGIYAAVFTAPVVSGQYSVVWNDATFYASEDLTVTTSAVAPVGVTGTGMTLGDILDAVLLDRFESDQRPRALQAVNLRFAHLWALEDWTFKFATENTTTAAGTQAMGGLPDDFGVPIYLWDENGVQLPYLNTDTFYSLYLPVTSNAPPEAWTVTNQSVLLGPTPDHVATYTLHYRKRLTQLSDESEVPDWPDEFRLAIVHGAGADLRAAYDDPTAGTWEQLLQLDLEALRREYLVDAVGQPDTWPDDLWAVA